MGWREDILEGYPPDLADQVPGWPACAGAFLRLTEQTIRQGHEFRFKLNGEDLNVLDRKHSTRALEWFQMGVLDLPFAECVLVVECEQNSTLHIVPCQRTGYGIVAGRFVRCEGQWTTVFSTHRLLRGSGTAVSDNLPEEEVGEAVLGTVVLSLLMALNTRGVQQERREPHEKLVRACERRGREAPRASTFIDLRPYVAALNDVTGSHASPVPHLRRGHPRTLASGKIILIPDALVNANGDVLGPKRYEVAA